MTAKAKPKKLIPRITRTCTQLAKKPLVATLYAVFAVLMLTATVVVWSLLSANVQLSNADQLVNSYLFHDAATFHGASLPGQHSFLLKWPLFWLIKMAGTTPTAFTVATVATVLCTVAVLVFVLWRIERRPFVFGTLCLAVASVLLLVPAAPYPGGLLPVNMAMVATRNLEYVLYIASLTLLVRHLNFKSWKFWTAIVMMGLLVASDRLFLVLSLGGAGLSICVYALARRWSLVSLSVRWLVMGVGAAAVAAVILWVIRISGIVHIIDEAAIAPYSVVHTAKNMVLGGIYAVLGVLSNFGANPAPDTRLLRTMPHQAVMNMWSAAGFGYLVNTLILIACMYAVCRLVYGSIHAKGARVTLDGPNKIALLLAWTSMTAIAVFVATSHYYPVDARYVSITFFALFICFAAYGRRYKWQPKTIAFCAVVISFAIVSGICGTVRTYHQEKAALAVTDSRNVLIAQALHNHHVSVLVGDYWRVVPIKLVANKKLHIMPLSDCTTPRDVLSSRAWQPGLGTHSFAYLLTLDTNLTGFPSCTFDQITQKYGRPNASVTIAGTVSNPKELLLFYDKGADQSAPITSQSTVEPVAPEQLPYTTCSVPTVMNIVAHQDDDLLFINPDLAHDIKAKKCIRTVYVTAGDAGSDSFYWLSREKGSERAYSALLGTDNPIWVERTAKLADNEFVTVANPRGDPAITLIFMHLPDGNVHGDGFSSSHYESLARLEAGKIPAMQTVDGQSAYTSTQLTAALANLMHVYQPTEIRTQASITTRTAPDHSDHMAVGRFVQRAHAQYVHEQYQDELTIPLKFYIGYPGREMVANVTGADLDDKDKMFFAYARFDGGACRSIVLCQSTNYRYYLTRQYEYNQ